MMYIGDTKAGTFIAADRYGNKYYENLEEELPLRTRWVDYKNKEYDPFVFPPVSFLASLFDAGLGWLGLGWWTGRGGGGLEE